ncbi:MAG: hypothetical protein F6K40_03020 [Okeania sp. SIO3I5]|uniref:hypothetical protein n=1 Tax=Okeania sp. SIO3I5 TaxID=2607805 RepID=UPI0013BBD087|nr:hypothetical protein [Okeania sp. SIO3I5]NEQ35334.1 hypothetical protein [Okeania sp. SIO3I5]
MTIHLLRASASENVLTIALYATEEKFDYSSLKGECFRKCIGYSSLNGGVLQEM